MCTRPFIVTYGKIYVPYPLFIVLIFIITLIFLWYFLMLTCFVLTSFACISRAKGLFGASSFMGTPSIETHPSWLGFLVKHFDISRVVMRLKKLRITMLMPVLTFLNRTLRLVAGKFDFFWQVLEISWCVLRFMALFNP